MPEIATDDGKAGGLGQENPFAEYNNRTFQSFVENGFADKIPHGVEAPNTRIKRFVSSIDLAKVYERKITTIQRRTWL